MSMLHQMPHRSASPFLIFHRDLARIQSRKGAVQHDDRNIPGPHILQLCDAGGIGGNNQNSSDVPRFHDHEFFCLAGPIAFGGQKQGCVPVFRRHPLHGMRTGGKEGIRQVGNDQTNRSRHLPLENPGGLIRFVAKLGDGFANPRDLRGTHQFAAIHHAGNSHGADATLPGDICDRRIAWQLPRHEVNRLSGLPCLQATLVGVGRGQAARSRPHSWSPLQGLRPLREPSCIRMVRDSQL